ncbi:chromosome segregation protein SMC [Weissella halotolerans]|uniref:Chromosome partition protein Smc n=1 Tax=Weissella halotolerans DSM 20190 TaxID=1123500 RepID=A0A0R2G4G6_9LACO|nr:chromosome segregation protein SMC [Weissella halotolerans]KRN31716.1 Barmotin [Weissella halotolerans DSM 20190]
MKLKTLEISGFKSFAQKTKIDFMPGITGVVGPNGSGKSNIIEAIRWVMGEQSAKGLRGDKMADVIFGGTADRKPLNRAQVIITFDNSDHYLQTDYTEIQIARTLYRTGESKYQINGTTVRLRDIQELFMDSGLGRESFSIISQGRVEQIFSAKPADRRAVIEEVAGVYKYKQNKDKATAELSGVQDKLDRVQDILFEIRQRLEPLAQQSAQAQDYLTQKAEFDQLDQARLVLAIQDGRQAAGQLANQQADYEGQLATLHQIILDLEADLTAQKQARQELTTKRQTAQTELLATATRVEQLLGEQKLQAERQTSRSQASHDLAAEIEKTKANQVYWQQTIQERQAEIDLQLEKTATLTEQVKRIKNQLKALDAQTLQTEIDQKRSVLVEQMQRVATLKNQAVFLKQEYQRQTVQSERLHKQLAEVNQALTKVQVTLAQGQADLEQAKAQQQAQKEALAQAQQAGQKLESDFQTARQTWYNQLEKEQRVQTRLQTLKHLADQYEGYYQGVKHLMQARQQFPGIAGVVAELITVPKDQQLAIETALGGALQQVVVDQATTAKTAIKYLTTHRLGRVTFLPLNTVRPRHLATSLLESAQASAGFVGLAADLVTVAAEYRPVIAHLLGTTVIAQDLTTAMPMAKALLQRVRIVTLDGQVINAGGAMTGGANRQQGQGLLSQRQTIDQLTKEGHQLAQQSQQAEERVRTLEHQVQVAAKAFKKQQADLLTVNEDVQNLTHTVQNAKEELARMQKERAALHFELESNGIESEDGHRQPNHQVELETAQQEQADLQTDLDQALQKQAAASQARQRYQAELTECETELARAKAQLEAAQVRKADSQKQAQQAQERMDSLQKQRADLSADQGQVRARIEHDLTEQTTKKDALTAQVQDLDKQLETKGQTIAQVELALENRRHQQGDLMTKSSEVARQKAQVTTNLDHAQTTLQEDYGLDYAAAKAAVTLTMPLADIETKLKLLKRGLADIGPVNLQAIDEYTQVKERYDFLEQQQADLIEARDNLEATMGEMDQEVKTRFAQTFAAVAKHFATIFVKMFGGGQAELLLTDPDHLLTTGVDIKAQPPGKKFQQMSLLSGGERALTAISLLFAILEVRPVPFVVLDETEAALDEANVTRFAQYLHEVNDRTQFIVITHRKGTMANADVLYGVTMQEPGVSTMVSVDLTEVLPAQQEE